MSLSPGTRIGSYEVVALLGAGGMGEVYRARDTRLNRDVALKVLPDAFALDPERRARFEREAQFLAALSHPQIATIHGIDETDGRITLVMELVEGPTLADRLTQGALSDESARSIADNICDALEYAHERGIVHRDLKPANIKVAAGDTVKVLDFGLAKALNDAPPEQNLTHSPTLSLGATRHGMILGTAGYMAPEQARGQTVDRRGDIWAFGCILFEMLTGKQAFAGGTISDTLAAVLRAEPDWAALPLTTTSSIRRLLRRCLEKDPRRRLQHIGDARLELVEVEPAASRSSAPAPRRLLWPMIAAGLTGAVVAGVAAWMLAPRPATGSLTRFTVPLPAESSFLEFGGTGIAVSPDGRMIAYTADSPPGLAVRRLDRTSVERLRGGEGASSPFFSHDGASIAFFSDNQLKKVPADGGIPVTISENVRPGSGAWSSNGTIAFTSLGDLYEAPSDGGAPLLVLKSDAGKHFRSRNSFRARRRYSFEEARPRKGSSRPWTSRRARLVR